MIVTKRALPRRTFLRGMGVAVALPLLDSMVPALSAMSRTAAKPIRRFGFFYLPNGVAMNHTGIDYWKPKTVGENFEFNQSMEALKPFRNQLTVVSGLHHRSAERSADQLIAQTLGQETPLPSLELAILPNSVTGGCDTGYSCAYGTTVSWSSPSTPLPTQSSPRLVFEQLFGDGGPASEQLKQLRIKNSILDSVGQEMSKLQAKLGPADRVKVADHLDAIREVERRIQLAEANNAASPLPEYERPGIGVPERFDDHVTLMFDLLHLAYQADVTRVSTFMFGKELSARMYPEIGLAEQHHSMSHHGDNPENIAKYAKVVAFELQLFSQLVEKMRNTPDGDGTLLDHSMLLLGASLSNPHIHSHIDMPTAIVGGGVFKGNRHVATKMGTPFSNLLLSVVNKAGVPRESFGDSTGVLDLDAITLPTNL